jgi:hypothetical protein
MHKLELSRKSFHHVQEYLRRFLWWGPEVGAGSGGPFPCLTKCLGSALVCNAQRRRPRAIHDQFPEPNTAHRTSQHVSFLSFFSLTNVLPTQLISSSVIMKYSPIVTATLQATALASLSNLFAQLISLSRKDVSAPSFPSSSMAS